MKLTQLLSNSSVSDRFRSAVDSFLHSGRPNDQIVFGYSSPPVKVARTITKMLEEYGHLPIESVQIEGQSGCEFYRGELIIRTVEEERSVSFHWDCRWKAEQEGWVDYFGFPDQIRAAQVYDYQCFKVWKEKEVRPFVDA
jgi:hypothetical protein